MSQKIIDKCPSCGNNLSISSLKCNSCGIEIKGDFEIPKKEYNLNEEDMKFIKVFLKYEGRISSVQRELNVGYMSIKSKLRSLNLKLGNDIEQNRFEDMNFPIPTVRLGKVSATIVEKLKAQGGSASCPMLRGEPMNIWLTKEGVANSAYPDLICEWKVFDEIVHKAYDLGGKMFKGDSAAQSGAKIGSPELPDNTIDSFISLKFYGKGYGDTTLRRSTYYAAILAWAGICTNTRSTNGEGGYIAINPTW